ncbi:MAG: acyl-CoA dehydrogenase family protein, partial [Actinobacteria bacterium]|nr:acyl-CoA dehydrogenase family protein [Actinomycetota bacterium]
MDLTLTEDQRLIQSTARELLDSRAAAAGARAVSEDQAGCPAGYSASLWKEIVELGWTGLAFPESCGGVGEGFLELCLVIEELGRARVPTPLVATVACCGMPILACGTEAQRAEWLGAIARGQVMSYVSGHDADNVAGDGVAGDAVAGGHVRAERSGDGFVLDGDVSFVPYADAAEQLLVTARHRDGTIAAVVDAAAPGIGREPLDVIADPV